MKIPQEAAKKKKKEFGEWQLCPKCNGEGQVYRQDVFNDTTAITAGWFTCPVCNGAKILAKPTLESVPPYKEEVDSPCEREKKGGQRCDTLCFDCSTIIKAKYLHKEEVDKTISAQTRSPE